MKRASSRRQLPHFVSKGYSETTTEEIAVTAGINEVTLFGGARVRPGS